MRSKVILVLLVFSSFQTDAFGMMRKVKDKLKIGSSGSVGSGSGKGKAAISGEGTLTESATGESWKASDLPDRKDNQWLLERVAMDKITRQWLIAGIHYQEADMYPHPLHLMPFLNELRIVYGSTEDDQIHDSLFSLIERAINILSEQDLNTQKAQEAVASFFAVLARITGIGRAYDVGLSATNKAVRRWLKDDQCPLRPGLMQLVGKDTKFQRMYNNLIYLWEPPTDF